VQNDKINFMTTKHQHVMALHGRATDDQLTAAAAVSRRICKANNTGQTLLKFIILSVSELWIDQPMTDVSVSNTNSGNPLVKQKCSYSFRN
jgi:hypothetical protein